MMSGFFVELTSISISIHFQDRKSHNSPMPKLREKRNFVSNFAHPKSKNSVRSTLFLPFKHFVYSFCFVKWIWTKHKFSSIFLHVSAFTHSLAKFFGTVGKEMELHYQTSLSLSTFSFKFSFQKLQCVRLSIVHTGEYQFGNVLQCIIMFTYNSSDHRSNFSLYRWFSFTDIFFALLLTLHESNSNFIQEKSIQPLARHFILQVAFEFTVCTSLLLYGAKLQVYAWQFDSIVSLDLCQFYFYWFFFLILLFMSCIVHTDRNHKFIAPNS